MSARRILIAGDESAIRIVLARTLQRAGFEVVVANDGQDALAIGGLLVAVGELCGNAIKHAYEVAPASRSACRLGLHLVRSLTDEASFDVARPRGTRWTLLSRRG
jgi:two-component sensor histidine kinase